MREGIDSEKWKATSSCILHWLLTQDHYSWVPLGDEALEFAILTRGLMVGRLPRSFFAIADTEGASPHLWDLLSENEAHWGDCVLVFLKLEAHQVKRASFLSWSISGSSRHQEAWLSSPPLNISLSWRDSFSHDQGLQSFCSCWERKPEGFSRYWRETLESP